MTDDQFIFSGVTGRASGQKEKNHSGMRKRIEVMLMIIPYLPRDHLRGGRGSPRLRLRTKQPMVMI